MNPTGDMVWVCHVEAPSGGGSAYSRRTLPAKEMDHLKEKRGQSEPKKKGIGRKNAQRSEIIRISDNISEFLPLEALLQKGFPSFL